MKRFAFLLFCLFGSFLGGAAAQTLPFVSVALGAYQALAIWTGAAGTGIPTWISSHWGFSGARTSSMLVTPLLSVSSNGGWAGAFATRSSDNTGNTYPCGVCTLGVLDATGQNVWGQYIQSEMLTAGTGKQLFGAENSVYNSIPPVTNVDPFTTNVGNQTSNYRMDCGTGQTVPTPTNCATALQILNNGAMYSNAPLQIADNTVDTSLSAQPPAIAMPVNYAYAGYTSAGVIGFKMFGGAGSPAGVVSCTARCLYLRTDGGANTTLYINETGGGTSGWAAK